MLQVLSVIVMLPDELRPTSDHCIMRYICRWQGLWWPGVLYRSVFVSDSLPSNELTALSVLQSFGGLGGPGNADKSALLA